MGQIGFYFWMKLAFKPADKNVKWKSTYSEGQTKVHFLCLSVIVLKIHLDSEIWQFYIY